MRAEVGDEVEVCAAESSRPGRIGTVVAVQGDGSSPRYLIHWLTGYESLIAPGPGDHVEVHHRMNGEPGPPAAGLAGRTTRSPDPVRRR